MESISVDLLPKDILEKRKEKSKSSLLAKLSIVCLIIVGIITAVVISLRITQKLQIKNAEADFSKASESISQLKDKEVKINNLKKHLGTIAGAINVDEKRKAMFNLIVNLTPEDMTILSVDVDKSSNLTLDLQTSNLSSIDTFINDLGDKEKNKGLLKKVDLDSLSYGVDGIYKLTLKITS